MSSISTEAIAERPFRDRLIRVAEVKLITGLSRSTIYSLVAKEEFPPAVTITAGCVGWSEAAVLEFVRERIESSLKKQANRTHRALNVCPTATAHARNGA